MEGYSVKSTYYDPDYKIKRKNGFTTIGYRLCSVLHLIYKISYQNIERLEPLAEKGFMLLPKHQSWLDIPLEEMLLKDTLNRYAYFIMKNSLPQWIFEPLGGISIIRRKDMKNLIKKYIQEYKNKDKNMSYAEMKHKAVWDALKEASKQRDKVYEYDIPNLLARREIIVTHIEGTRHFRESVQIDYSNINRLLKVQKVLGEQILFVPLNFEYHMKEGYVQPTVLSKEKQGLGELLHFVKNEIKQLCSIKSITLKVGNPIQIKDDGLDELLEHLRNEIELWY